MQAFTGRNGSSAATVPEGRVVPPDPWHRVRVVLLLAYTAAYATWFALEGIILDGVGLLLSVMVLLVLLNVGRGGREWGRLLVDVVLYTAMWLAYDETRGASDHLGFPVQVSAMGNIDRVLFLGTDPNAWLQRTFYSAQHVRWYDVAASLLYFSHFVVPFVVIVVLWVRDHREWVRFMRRFATVLLIACVSFVVLPTAPPWMAADGALARPAGRGWVYLGLRTVASTWETGRDWTNDVAAMPSLHAAYSLFVVAFFLPRIRRTWVKAVLLAYPLAMGIALVYLAEHYVVDVLAGWAVVGVSFLVWNRIERRSRQRRAARSRAALGAPAGAVERPKVAVG